MVAAKITEIINSKCGVSYGSFPCYFELVLKPNSRLSYTPGCWKLGEIAAI